MREISFFFTSHQHLASRGFTDIQFFTGQYEQEE